ncbi:MAG TPA: Sjogren's syndrome/scleroderma autoantigen 1 family protein [Methanotrichaceae archaeon]|nr:Sjogren's syndrome/scleroderma autoantigen 1 family protein [Methanotrichaceae archaeon]
MMDEEEMISKITKLLEQGCTMLATHHSCGAPLFRCKGEIVCPVCAFEGGAEAKSAEQAPEIKPAAEKPREEVMAEARHEPSPEPAEQDLVERELKEAILGKIRDLTSGLRSEQDLSKLKSQLDCLEAALRVLRSLER